jgi:NCS2 family nucleobase:cation symporter-2
MRGARILSAVDVEGERLDLLVVALSVGFGMIPPVAPGVFKALPHALHPLLESGLLLAAIVSVALNAFLDGTGTAEAAKAEVAGKASAVGHV